MDNLSVIEQEKSKDKSMDSQRDKQIDFIKKMADNPGEEGFFTLKWTLRAIFVCIILLAVVYYFAESAKNPDLINVNDVINKTGIRSRIMTMMGDKNILFLGVDSNGRGSNQFYGTRSDTILLINIDRHGKSLNVISIPRDSKVYLAGGKGVDKINAAHALGGPELTVKTIEDTFGIHISNYIVINYAGVKDFVREFGGVPVNVSKRMYYMDRAAGLTIDLQPGYQTLNAQQAEGYLRFRHDAQGDIGRIKRQQVFVKALVNKLVNAENVLKAPQLFDIMSKNIRTDMNLFELSKLFNTVKNIKPEEIQVATLPGKPSKYTYISYWILNAEKTQKIIDRLIYRTEPKKTEENLTVSIFYSPKLSNKIENIVDKFNEQGFSVKFRTPEDNIHSEIIAHTKKAAFKKIEPLKESIPELKNSQYIVAPEEKVYPCTDFTVVLGE